MFGFFFSHYIFLIHDCEYTFLYTLSKIIELAIKQINKRIIDMCMCFNIYNYYQKYECEYNINEYIFSNLYVRNLGNPK